jgi:ribosomal-protein-alanine N-acetyltransferase
MVARPDDLDPARDDLVVVVTPMRRRHLRGVLRIEHQVYPRPWSVGLYMSELSFGPTRLYLVARVDASVVGYSGLMIVGEDGHITTVAVEPRWHRHHIASRVLVSLVREAAVRGVKNLTLEVRMSNEGAQAMYRRFGFVPAGARKGYYVDNNEDALVMWAHDIDTPEYAERIAGIEASIRGRTVVEGIS